MTAIKQSQNTVKYGIKFDIKSQQQHSKQLIIYHVCIQNSGRCTVTFNWNHFNAN